MKQISKDHKTCEDSYRETLYRLFQSRKLTWSKIIEALRQPTIEHNNLATKIESAVVASTLASKRLRKLSFEELCLLPVDKVWYQLGLWLRIDEKG